LLRAFYARRARRLLPASGNVTLFLPIGLMLLPSIIGTIVLNIFLRR
jgi:hypothetical protein